MDLEIISKVREVLETGYTFCSVEEDASLIEQGYIDSVNIVGLTLELESKFGIRIPQSDMTPENWTSVRSIAQMCTRIMLAPDRQRARRELHELILGSRSTVDLLEAEVARARRHSYAVSLVVLRLGESLNDSDTAVLSETWLDVGRTIAGKLRVEDCVALIRLEHEEGALLGMLPHATDKSAMTALHRIGRVLLDGFAERYRVKGLRYGLATFPADGNDPQALITTACSEWHHLDLASLEKTGTAGS